MYRTSSHEPRYKQSSTRKVRHEESREASENSTSEEEEEESTDSGTEESGDTVESRGSESHQKESLYSADSSCHQRKPFNKQNAVDSFVTSHVCHSKVAKHDKITQKNLLSPFPSFTIPPIYRELSGAGYRGQSGRANREKHIEVRRPLKERSPKRRDSDYEKEESACCIHNPCEQKGFSKHRGQKDHQSRSNRSERILACVNTSTTIEPSGKGPPEMTSAREPMPAPAVTPRRPKTADRETVTASKCPESRVRSRQKPAAGTSPLVADQTGDVAPAKGKRSRKVAGDGSGEVREKLVYVVEEKGKDVAKLETDLFTLNEILAIKKDLLELSEFAKKLKKLKEMKRESETGTNHQISCQCKPAAELLKDVNRRIEALEARQEELERGSKSDQKGDTETDSKKTTNGKKTWLDSQSKTPVTVKASAMTTIPSFPKMEMFMSRTDNFSNNSDIVNELMDIKTQLHKLEQKRMSKGVPEDALRPEDFKQPKKDDRAIAVFSSKTYILTENFDKRKQNVKTIDEDKLNNYCSTVEEGSRKEQTKEHVENWLKSVSPKNEENAYLPPSGPKRDDNPQGGNERKADYSQVLKVENQEPQKNRATEKDGRDESDEVGFADARKNDSPGDQSGQPMKYRECIVTPSGKIFACVNSSSGRISADCSKQCRPKSAQGPSPQPRSQVNERTEFSCSIPSAVLAKERVRKLKADVPRRRRCGRLLPRIIVSKSVQELSVNSSKTEKTVRNTNLKNIDKMAEPRDKKHKDGKNQCLKLLEAHLMALRKTLKRGSTTTSSCTHSEFLASVNLDSGSTSDTIRLHGSGDNKAMVMAYSATTKRENDINVEDCLEERGRRRTLREEEKRRKRREAECKRMLKKKMKEKKQCEVAERKRRREEEKCQMKQLKQRCKELNYCKPFEESLPKKKSRSLDNCTPIRRSVEVCTPKRSRSSQEFTARKSQYTDDYGFKNSFGSEDSTYRRKHRPVEDQPKKYFCEVMPSSKHRRSEEEEHFPRKRRYREEEFDERYKEDVPRRYYEKEAAFRRHYEKEEAPRRYYEKEEAPRRYYEKEEPSRRYYEREDVPRRYKYEEEEEEDEEEDDFAQRYKEETARRQCGKEEIARKQRLEQTQILKKLLCEDVPRRGNRSSREKHNKEDYQRSSEDKSETSQGVKSEDSWRIYKKRQEEQLRKMKYQMNKRPSESCKLKNVMKNLGMLKINFPFAGEFCDGKHTKCKKSKTPETTESPEKPEKERQKDERRRDKEQKREREDRRERQERREREQRREIESFDNDKFQWEFSPFNDDEDEYEYDDEEYRSHTGTYPEHHSRHDRNDHPHADQQHYSHHHNGNCRCVRVYLQSQMQRGWSGLRPFQKLSSDSATEVTSSKTTGSSKTFKNNFGLPKVKSPVFQVGYSCQEKDDKCIRKCRKKREKCERKNCKRKHKHKKRKCKGCCMDDDSCRCKKCGNIHRKGAQPEPVRCRPPLPPQLECCKPQPGFNPKEPDSAPLFSFLSHFCKSRPRDPKAARFLKKLDEVRYLKMCATRKPAKRRDWSKGSRVTCNMEDKCNCRAKLTDIESRLSMLENTKDECVEKCCRKKHKKKKKKHKSDKKGCKYTDCEYRCAECCDSRRKDCGDCQRKERIEYERKDYGGYPKKECIECGGKGCRDCGGKGCSECGGKGCRDCGGKGCSECGGKGCRDCGKKGCSECGGKGCGECGGKNCSECGRKDCSECEKKECFECKKKRKEKKKKKCSYEECCPPSDTEDYRKKKHKKRKKCKCYECETGECLFPPAEKPLEPLGKPCETAAYYQTIYCPSAGDTKNNSWLTMLSKSSTVDEKESMESKKSKEEPPQKMQRMKEGLSSLHSFWRNLRKYKITYGRSGMESLMKKIRGKKSTCTLEPDISLADDLSKESEMARLRKVAEMEARRDGKSKNKAEQVKKERRERKNPENPAAKSCRKRHE